MSAIGMPGHLLALFAPRAPLEPVVTPRKRRREELEGMSQFVDIFESTPPPPVPPFESPKERRERLKRIRMETHAAAQKQAIESYEPLDDPDKVKTADPMKTIFVGRISYETTERHLLDALEVYGPIVDVRIVSDNRTGKSRGYAFVEFQHAEDMKVAYREAEGKRIDGRRILVDVERGRTQEGWLPRRLGGGRGPKRFTPAKKAVAAAAAASLMGLDAGRDHHGPASGGPRSRGYGSMGSGRRDTSYGDRDRGPRNRDESNRAGGYRGGGYGGDRDRDRGGGGNRGGRYSGGGGYSRGRREYGDGGDMGSGSRDTMSGGRRGGDMSGSRGGDMSGSRDTMSGSRGGGDMSGSRGGGDISGNRGGGDISGNRGGGDMSGSRGGGDISGGRDMNRGVERSSNRDQWSGSGGQRNSSSRPSYSSSSGNRSGRNNWSGNRRPSDKRGYDSNLE